MGDDDETDFRAESLMSLMLGKQGGGGLHDLSAWRVTIPAIASKPELENPRKNFYTYVIDVNR